MSNLAETILRDVPRYGTDPDDCDGFIPTPDGAWLDRDEVLAAITAALDPALTERAGEVLEGVTPGPWVISPANVVCNQIDAEHHAICTDQFCYAPEKEANARFIAWCREGVPALLAQNAVLRAERDASNELGRAFEEDAGQQRERAAIASLPAQGVRVPSAADEPEDGEIRQVIVNAKWKPCVSGGGWWVAQDVDGQRILLSPDGFLAALEPASGGVEATAPSCTCHPDDNPPKPCRHKYALGECRRDAATETVDALVKADRSRKPPKMHGNEPFTQQQLSDRMDRMCGCNGRWDCDCISVWNKARAELWEEANAALAAYRGEKP